MANVPRRIARRDLLGALGAAAIGAIADLGGDLGACSIAHAQSPQSPAKPHRIDVHHHFSAPQWIAEVKGREMLQRANADWTPARSIEDMDQAGIATSIVSITNPGLWFGDAAVTARVSRECNEFGARLVSDHKGRFGLFAALPLPDVDETLKEIRLRLRHLES